MKTENTQREQMEIARMRFGIIAPLVQGTYPDESIAAYCRRVAQTPLALPDGVYDTLELPKKSVRIP